MHGMLDVKWSPGYLWKHWRLCLALGSLLEKEKIRDQGLKKPGVEVENIPVLNSGRHDLPEKAPFLLLECASLFLSLNFSFLSLPHPHLIWSVFVPFVISYMYEPGVMFSFLSFFIKTTSFVMTEWVGRRISEIPLEHVCIYSVFIIIIIILLNLEWL